MMGDKNTIAFNRLFDKLNDDKFTTIRSFKYKIHYLKRMGQPFEVWYAGEKGYKICDATLIEQSVISPAHLTEEELEYDTRVNGIPDHMWMLELGGMDIALRLTFKKIDNEQVILA